MGLTSAAEAFGPAGFSVGAIQFFFSLERYAADYTAEWADLQTTRERFGHIASREC
jgi:hypothetical protein